MAWLVLPTRSLNHKPKHNRRKTFFFLSRLVGGVGGGGVGEGGGVIGAMHLSNLVLRVFPRKNLGIEVGTWAYQYQTGISVLYFIPKADNYKGQQFTRSFFSVFFFVCLFFFNGAVLMQLLLQLTVSNRLCKLKAISMQYVAVVLQGFQLDASLPGFSENVLRHCVEIAAGLQVRSGVAALRDKNWSKVTTNVASQM